VELQLLNAALRFRICEENSIARADGSVTLAEGVDWFRPGGGATVVEYV
jgi:hypothetical protein